MPENTDSSPFNLNCRCITLNSKYIRKNFLKLGHVSHYPRVNVISQITTIGPEMTAGFYYEFANPLLYSSHVRPVNASDKGYAKINL